MFRQVLWPLKILHQAHYVHGDIKPDNICIRKRTKKKGSQSCKPRDVESGGRSEGGGYVHKPYISEYEFTLIDFGIISKFKVKKAARRYNSHIGNLMYSSHRGLRCFQTRYQDDVEALMYIVYVMIAGRLPWDVHFREKMKSFSGN